MKLNVSNTKVTTRSKLSESLLIREVTRIGAFEHFYGMCNTQLHLTIIFFFQIHWLAPLMRYKNRMENKGVIIK